LNNYLTIFTRVSHGKLVLLGKENISKTYEIKEFLYRNIVEFVFFEVEHDPEALILG